VYFTPQVALDSRVVFLRYVHDHLVEYAQNVVRLRHYSCGNTVCAAFGERITDQARIDRALARGGTARVFCPDCGEATELRDAIEVKFQSPDVKQAARELETEGRTAVDNESRVLSPRRIFH
jgi:hypothetical protein